MPIQKTDTFLSNNSVKRLALWAIAVAMIQMISFIGRFPWTVSDYVFVSVVLFGAAAMYEFISINVRSNMYRLIAAFGILSVVILIWAWAIA